MGGALDVSPARMDRLHFRIDAVTRTGAYACAPRELALARAHYDFAQIELIQGDLRRAQRHLEDAEENAGAAQVLTPEKGCAPSSPGDVPASLSPRQVASDRAACDLAEADGCSAIRQNTSHVPNVAPPDETHTEQPAPVIAAAVPSGGLAEQGVPVPCDESAGDTVCPKRSYANVMITDRELKLSIPITFLGESADLRDTSQSVLDVITQLLADHPSMTLEIAAHTDSRGDPARNLALSQQQAEHVWQYLIDHGVAATRLTAQGYGETRPIESNSTSRGRAINRRVELIRTDQVH
ncbi:MAG: hypothetical protein RL701_2096 [Pseudomonadota bacterium]|jgi:outer membrane protein OmpA-like peptidoglycan-associated protein